ncbi:MAG TPA: hypothetical protein VEZ40_04035 [Pyrinomonadaceae bacterium]|nr:hypothetical protein [Pyrinomonadaceae bacterium]
MRNMIRLALLASLFVVAYTVPAPAQVTESSWIKGIWAGEINFDENGQIFNTVSAVLRFNEQGYSVEFKNRECQAEWVLVSIDDRAATFRERITPPKGKGQTDPRRCTDGAMIVFKPAGGDSLRYHYQLPGSGARPGSGWFRARVTRDNTPDFQNYTAQKVGSFSYNRHSIYEIREFGLRVANIAFPLRRVKGFGDSQLTDTRTAVVAVQEGGPAFLAGVVPGDIIWSLRPNHAAWNGSWINENAASFAKSAEMNIRFNAINVLGLYYEVADSPYVETTHITLPSDGKNARGKWITEAPVHGKGARFVLPAVREAGTLAKTRYFDYEKEVVATIRNSPCRVDASQIEDMTKRLQDLATLSGTPRVEHNRKQHLTQAAEAICQNSRDGGLTRFESGLVAISLRLIDPCEYSLDKDYSELFNTFDSISFYSKKFYNESVGSEFDRNFAPHSSSRTAEQKACLTRLLRSAYDMPRR